MNMGQSAGADGQKANSSIKAIINSLKQPVVWAPMLAVAIVLCGIRMPDAFISFFRFDCKIEFRRCCVLQPV